MLVSLTNRIPLGYQQLTVSTVAVGLTVPKSGGDPADVADIRVASNPVRYRDDGTDPATGTGFPLNAGDIVSYDGDLSKIKFIRSTGADAVLDILYYAVP